jgi:hypothetical protein
MRNTFRTVDSNARESFSITTPFFVIAAVIGANVLPSAAPIKDHQQHGSLFIQSNSGRSGGQRELPSKLRVRYQAFTGMPDWNPSRSRSRFAPDFTAAPAPLVKEPLQSATKCLRCKRLELAR